MIEVCSAVADTAREWAEDYYDATD
jgi:hypothetical protein